MLNKYDTNNIIQIRTERGKFPKSMSLRFLKLNLGTIKYILESSQRLAQVVKMDEKELYSDQEFDSFHMLCI